jgi:HK97 family phage major capsid protein
VAIEPIASGPQPSDDIAKLLGRAGEIKAQLEENKLQSEQLAELKDNWSKIRTEISDLQAKENERQATAERDSLLTEMKAMLAQTRTPSKAPLIGNPQPRFSTPENFFATLARARSNKFGDLESQGAAQKALIEDFGSSWGDVPAESKATVGDSDGAGGYLVPNNVVADINLQAQPGRAVVDLFTVISNVRGSAVDIPWEQAADSRAVIAAAGATKENSNFIVNNYTATLYTLARIFDVGNQLLRQSEGAAEQLVRSKLARAFALGEDYYAIQGSGSSQPFGLLTALGSSGTYVTTHSSPATTTIAGNWATAVAKAAGAVADRGGTPTAVVMNSGDYWNSIVSGADSAGFYVDPQGGGFGFNPSGTASTGAGPWGLALRHTPNMPTDSLVVGDYKSATFFRGQGYRVDVSSEAGDRWDKNLTGFRGEEEIAFDARPAVYTGNFQRIVNVMA